MRKEITAELINHYKSTPKVSKIIGVMYDIADSIREDYLGGRQVPEAIQKLILTYEKSNAAAYPTQDLLKRIFGLKNFIVVRLPNSSALTLELRAPTPVGTKVVVYSELTTTQKVLVDHYRQMSNRIEHGAVRICDRFDRLASTVTSLDELVAVWPTALVFLPRTGMHYNSSVEGVTPTNEQKVLIEELNLLIKN